jgi:hypothetical protein
LPSISGRVLAADSTEPLVSASIKLVSEENASPAPSGPAAANRWQATTDDTGRFTLRAVPPGRYRVAVDREGYIHEEHFQYGPNQPTQSVLTINNNQPLENVTILMTPVPTISGVVYSPRGERLAGVASVLSHEGGEYRLFGLAPGYYYVSASLSSETRRVWRSMVTFTPNLPDADEGYANVFFRSEDDIAHAQFVHLFNNRSAANVDIAFHDVDYFKLSLKIAPQDPRSRPLVNATAALIPAGIDLAAARDFPMKRKGSDFTQDRVVRGDYVVVVMADYIDASNVRNTVVIAPPRPVHVDRDSEVTIETVEPIDIPGLLQGLGPIRPPAPVVELVRADYYSSQTYTAALNGDGTFRMSLIGPGVYDVFVSGLPSTAYVMDARLLPSERPLQHITIDGRRPLRFVDARTSIPTSIEAIVIAVSRTASSIAGSVVSAAKPIPGAEVVLVPVLEQSRLRKDRYFTTETDASGKFKFQGAPPEPYVAFAFEKIEADAFYDAEFISQIMARATSIPMNGRDADNYSLMLITLDDLAGMVR